MNGNCSLIPWETKVSPTVARSNFGYTNLLQAEAELRLSYDE